MMMLKTFTAMPSLRMETEKESAEMLTIKQVTPDLQYLLELC